MTIGEQKRSVEHDRKFMRPHEVASLFGVTARHITNQVEAGTIPATRLGRAILIPTSWVEKFVAAGGA